MATTDPSSSAVRNNMRLASLRHHTLAYKASSTSSVMRTKPSTAPVSVAADEFDVRSHNGRTGSAGGYSDWLEGDEWRPRVSSMPASMQRPPHLASLKERRALLEAQSRLRSFVITPRGTVQEHTLAATLAMTSNSHQHVTASRCASDVAVHVSEAGDSGLLENSQRQQREKVAFQTGHLEEVVPVHRVHVMGAPCVGKRALVREFITGDISGCFESLSGEEDERRITILLDGEKSTLEFMDKSDSRTEEGGAAPMDANADAYVVVYSVEDRLSLDTAADMLYELRRRLGRHTPVILVANKTDLVRTRVISEPDGKQMATNYDCKYIEVSAAIDHKVDDLLVGILKQIRLVKQRYLHDSRTQVAPSSTSSPPGSSSLFRGRAASARESSSTSDHCCLITGRHSVLRRIFGVGLASKSCDNLYVL